MKRLTDLQQGILECLVSSEKHSGKPKKGWAAVDVQDRGVDRYLGSIGVCMKNLYKNGFLDMRDPSEKKYSHEPTRYDLTKKGRDHVLRS